MTIANTPGVTSPLVSSLDPAGKAAQSRAASDAAREAEIATIKEKGFATYVKEMEEEKLKKMREEILEAMGLAEEDLKKMAPEARAAVEQSVTQEIQKRLAATSAVNGEGKGGQPAVQQILATAAQGGSTLEGAVELSSDAGINRVLLSLQEVDRARSDGAGADVKDSRERGRGLPL